MSLFNKVTTGVDLGTRTIKGVKLKKTPKGLKLERYFFHDLADGNDLYPTEANADEALAAAVTTANFKKLATAASLIDRDVLSHELVLPPMPVEEMMSAVTNSVEENFNLDPADCCIDYLKLDDIKEKGSTSQLLMTYCVKRENVVSLIERLTHAGLSPKAIESGILARVALLSQAGYLAHDKTYILLDLGESEIALSLVSREKVLLNNVLPVGLGIVNKLLFDRMGLTYLQSEEVKRRYDLLSQDEEAADPAQAHLDEIFYDLFYKIQRITEIYKLQAKGAVISQVLVTGGGSQMGHLDVALKTYCGIDTVIVNPLKNIEIAPDQLQDGRLGKIAPYLTTAVGLALREAL